ncbi:MAG: hypothetical protein GY749_45500 [Desulfobacteraceae bacterium]|nr:hypothetical protein [Desulfobacteraceae bacterium]
MKNTAYFKYSCFSLFFGIVCFFTAPVIAKDSLFVIRAEGKDYEQTVTGMKDELEEDISVTEYLIGNKTTKRDINREMKRVSPEIVVLMDNSAISFFKQYQQELPASVPVVPSVSLMASFTDLAIEGMKNATGIFYEVSVVSSVVNFRAILNKPIRKVGIVHRKFMGKSVTRDAVYCAGEKIELVPYAIPDSGRMKSNLKKGLKFLKKKHVNAIWVANDSEMLEMKLLQSVWRPFFRKYKKPVIVGVEILANPKLDFGTFAVIPDNISLGIQAAETVLDAMDNEWEVEAGVVAPPRSVYKIINLKKAKKLFKISEENLQDIDKILK